jgi:methylenetetrahydrofolate dehydrogenase (NADP+)/methenyltetrahydrofolate cyclohydrolase
MALVLHGLPAAKEIYDSIFKDLRQHSYSRKPCLATILIGRNSASELYIQKKNSACKELGFEAKNYSFDNDVKLQDVLELIEKLNRSNSVDGILVQKPIIDASWESVIFDSIDKYKDVDVFNPYNVGILSLDSSPDLIPCTPNGIWELLKYYKIGVAKKNVLIIGRSSIVGKPISQLLLNKDATVTVAHSKTNSLNEHIENADIVISAVGKSRFLTGKLPWKSSAVVIDVGINRDSKRKKISGDVDFESVEPKVYAITPVPGGVGPMTIACLMKNTLTCFKKGLNKNA